MIRVLVVDDHPALRAGLSTVVRAEPGLVHVGDATDAASTWRALDVVRPDVVLLDVHLPGEDGLQLCVAVKAHRPAPRVVLYSAHAGRGLVLPATLAGADALVSKAAPARELFDVIRRVARGGRVVPQPTREEFDDAAGRTAPEDLPLLGLLVQGAPHADVAAALGVPTGEVPARTRALLTTLHPAAA